MQRAGVLVALLVLGIAAWVGRGPSIPFVLTNEVELVLANWRNAGLSCAQQGVGMPGPMVSWYCTGEVEGVALGAGLEADSHGVFSISARVPAATAGTDAAGAFLGLIRATSLISAAEDEMEGWLTSTNTADGVMPVTATTGILRAAMSHTEPEGDPRLFVVPLGSSMLLVE